MAVQVRQTGHRDARDALGRTMARRLDAHDHATLYSDHDVIAPAIGREGGFEVKFTSHDEACTVSGSTC